LIGIAVVDSLRILRFIVPEIGLFARKRFAGHAVLTLDPAPEVDKLAPLSTEGTKRIFFPVDWLTAGWAFHESLKPRNGPQSIIEMRVA
jgi:hypothetical protein